jgi:predicted porin
MCDIRKKGPQRARKAGGSRCPALLALMLLAAAPFFTLGPFSASAVHAQEYGRFGLGLKTGAAAGPMGIQLAWNYNRHLQLCAGGGGTSELLAVLDRSRTDSYFLMGKYYLDHLYFETGYARKTTKAEQVQSEKARMTFRTEHAIPMHIGYEFGHRRGFYFSTTAGYFYVIGEGGVLVSPRIDAEPGKTAKSAESGFTAGLSVGYYLW